MARQTHKQVGIPILSYLSPQKRGKMECLRADQRVKNFSGALNVGSARLYAVPALAKSHFCFFVIFDPLFYY